MDKDTLSKSSHTTSVTKYEFTFVTLHCWTKYPTKAIKHSTQCLRKTTQFPHFAQNLTTTIAGQQQTLHLLLDKTTHSLATEIPEVEGRLAGEGEGIAPKKNQIMGIQYNFICTQLALS